MKGISIQFQNLINHLKNNINNQQILANRQSFDFVYEKITLQAFKLVSIIFDEVLYEQQTKSSFNKLTKQLKQFISKKPTIQDDQDDFYNQQFDELQQFMNSRKPINDDTDSFQRGDIYKFLSQAQSKQKDMQDFMGNIGNNKGGLKDKFKKSYKNLKNLQRKATFLDQIQTTQIHVQTDFNFQMFKLLQSKFPSIFKYPLKTKKQNQNSSQNNQEWNFQKQFFSRMNQIPSFKSSSKLQLIKSNSKNQQDEAKSEQNKKEQNKKKNTNNTSDSKKVIQNNIINNKPGVKPVPNLKGVKPTNKQSPSNTKSNSNLNSSINNKIKVDSKSKLINNQTLLDSKVQKKQTQSNKTQNNNNPNQSKNIKNNQSNQSLTSGSYQQQQRNFINNISKFMPTMDELKNILVGLSDQQIAKVYQSLQKNIISNAENPMFIIQTAQKQINTIQSNLNEQAQNKLKMKKMKSSKTSQFQQDQNNSGNFKKKTVKYKSDDNQSAIIQEDELQYSRSNNKNKTINKSKKLNNQSSESNLPLLNQDRSDNLLQSSDQITSAKNSKLTSQNRIQPWKSKQNKYINDLMNLKNNKQNNLQLSKLKKGLKNKINNNTHLPSLHKDNSQKGLYSVHDNQLESYDSKYLKNSYSTHANHLRNSLSNSSGLQAFNDNQNFDNLLLKNKNNKKLQQISSTQQQRIMKQLQKISNSGNLKSNLNKIFMYVQFIQSVHMRRCGSKCVHLQRFYAFLKKKNLPSRIQLFPHKTDMNININM